MNKVLRRVGLSGALIVSNLSMVFATTNTYAENAGKWVLDGLFWIVLIAGIFAGAMSAIRRNALAAIGIFVTTAVVVTIIKDPNILVTLGTTLKGIFGL